MHLLNSHFVVSKFDSFAKDLVCDK